jgi:uncharacterized protein (DUF302 family)
MPSHDVSYGFTRSLTGVGFDEVVRRTTEALAKEGFGVLTTIDLKETLKRKINVDFRRYLILGACHPHLAHRALGADLGVGLVMPCNVTVFEGDDGSTVVQMVRPVSMFPMVKSPGLEPILREADQCLARALAAI